MACISPHLSRDFRCAIFAGDFSALECFRMVSFSTSGESEDSRGAAASVVFSTPFQKGVTRHFDMDGIGGNSGSDDLRVVSSAKKMSGSSRLAVKQEPEGESDDGAPFLALRRRISSKSNPIGSPSLVRQQRAPVKTKRSGRSSRQNQVARRRHT